jgi:hypothetical protein
MSSGVGRAPKGPVDLNPFPQCLLVGDGSREKFLMRIKEVLKNLQEGIIKRTVRENATTEIQNCRPNLESLVCFKRHKPLN